MKKSKYYLSILTFLTFLLSFTVGCSKSDSTAPVTTPQSQNSQQNQTTDQPSNNEQTNASQQTPNTQQTPSTQMTPDREITTDIPQTPNKQVTPNAQQPNVKNIVPDNTNEFYYIDLIRGGTLYDYPWVTVGDAFDYYFGESNWYEFYDDYNNHIIEVEGIGYEYGEYVLINVQFILYSNGEFESWGLWVNGELRSDTELRDFIDTVFNS